MKKGKELIHRTVKRILRMNSIYEAAKKEMDVILRQMILDLENTEREG